MFVEMRRVFASFFGDSPSFEPYIGTMVEILHSRFPPDIEEITTLPGVSPLKGMDWFSVDEAYSDQVRYRRQLISQKREFVLQDQAPEAQEPIEELFEAATVLMPKHGFSITHRHIFCPDGSEVDREADSALAVLGKSLQQDLCVLVKSGDEHVLAAAVLCFPASWTLGEKIGRPLTVIHRPVQSYDDSVARRVQRLFDGVRVENPLRRNNHLKYDNADLFQPMSEMNPQRQEPPLDRAKFLRAERQIIFRLPETKAVVFSIHSFVVRA